MPPKMPFLPLPSCITTRANNKDKWPGLVNLPEHQWCSSANQVVLSCQEQAQQEEKESTKNLQIAANLEDSGLYCIPAKKGPVDDVECMEGANPYYISETQTKPCLRARKDDLNEDNEEEWPRRKVKHTNLIDSKESVTCTGGNNGQGLEYKHLEEVVEVDDSLSIDEDEGEKRMPKEKTQKKCLRQADIDHLRQTSPALGMPTISKKWKSNDSDDKTE
ncbi:hypothetical protein APHAL10511_003401, partial [Amanita phalloides]